jgi:hypothetical protein
LLVHLFQSGNLGIENDWLCGFGRCLRLDFIDLTI